MAISIKTCPHCKNTTSGIWSIGVGKPFVECRNCGKMFVDRDATEWELKNIFQKILFLVPLLYTSFLLGVAPILIYAVLVDYPSDTAVKYIWMSSSFVAALFCGWHLVGDIKASKERMKDPDYRQILQSIGLLKH